MLILICFPLTLAKIKGYLFTIVVLNSYTEIWFNILMQVICFQWNKLCTKSIYFLNHGLLITNVTPRYTNFKQDFVL